MCVRTYVLLMRAVAVNYSNHRKSVLIVQYLIYKTITHQDLWMITSSTLYNFSNYPEYQGIGICVLFIYWSAGKFMFGHESCGQCSYMIRKHMELHVKVHDNHYSISLDAAVQPLANALYL